MAHYIHDDNNNRIEGMSKEEIYALLAEAIQEGELPSVDTPTAFVTMIKSIVDGNPYKIGLCTQAEYNSLEAQGLLETDALYIITDDTTYDDLIIYINNQITTLTDNVAANTTSIAANTNAIAANTTSIAANTNVINVLQQQIKLYRHDIKITKSTTPTVKIYLSFDSRNNTPASNFFNLVLLLNTNKEIFSYGRFSKIESGSTIIGTIYSFMLEPSLTTPFATNITVNYNTNDSTTDFSETFYDETEFTVIDDVTKIFDAADAEILDPTVSYVETGEQGGFIYADVVITNPNASAVTLYYKTSSDASYSSVTIAANGTYTIGNYVEGTSGTVYLSNGVVNSNIINWVI